MITTDKEKMKKTLGIVNSLLNPKGYEVEITYSDDEYEIRAFDGQTPITVSDGTMCDKSGKFMYYFSCFTLKEGQSIFIHSNGDLGIDFGDEMAVTFKPSDSRDCLLIEEYTTEKVCLSRIELTFCAGFVVETIYRLLPDGKLCDLSFMTIARDMMSRDGKNWTINFDEDEYYNLILNGIMSYGHYCDYSKVKRVVEFMSPALRECINNTISNNFTNSQNGTPKSGSGGKI